MGIGTLATFLPLQATTPTTTAATPTMSE